MTMTPGIRPALSLSRTFYQRTGPLSRERLGLTLFKPLLSLMPFLFSLLSSLLDFPPPPNSYLFQWYSLVYILLLSNIHYLIFLCQLLVYSVYTTLIFDNSCYLPSHFLYSLIYCLCLLIRFLLYLFYIFCRTFIYSLCQTFIVYVLRL